MRILVEYPEDTKSITIYDSNGVKWIYDGVNATLDILEKDGSNIPPAYEDVYSLSWCFEILVQDGFLFDDEDNFITQIVSSLREIYSWTKHKNTSWAKLVNSLLEKLGD